MSCISNNMLMTTAQKEVAVCAVKHLLCGYMFPCRSRVSCRRSRQQDSGSLTHLEVNVDVISKDVHAEELAAADLTGVLLIAVSQQVLVHVAPAGEYLCTQTHTNTHTLRTSQSCGQLDSVWSELTCCHQDHESLLLGRVLTLPQMGQGDGSFLYLVPSSPLASRSSLFMCFGPVQMHYGR